MRWPRGFKAGQVIDGMVSQIDIFPTLCDLLGIDSPSWLQGKSMHPLLEEESEEINEQIFAEVSYHAAYEPQRAVRTQRYKYIRRWVEEHTGHRTTVLPNCDDSLSKDVLMRGGWGDRECPNEQLYDLIFDPNETRNLVGDLRMEDVLNDMRTRLANWMQTTNDPLLAGVVPMPEGAFVNPVDGVSPREQAKRT